MAERRIVAVVSDFGADSFYIGVMKGVVLAAAPDSRVVDLTHTIPPHAVDQASFILDTVSDFFPAGTVFLAVVDPGVGGARDNLVVEADGRYIVGADNGIATEVLARAKRAAPYVINDEKIGAFRSAPPTGRTFLGRDVFAPAAAALAAGSPPASIGSPARSAPVALDLPAVSTGKGVVAGRARYIDGFGNVLTGITRAQLTSVFGDLDPAKIVASVGGAEIGELCSYYSQRPKGTLMAVLNSWDRVELSICEGRAADRFSDRSFEELVVELREGGKR